MSALLTVEHLTMRFGGLVAVDDLSFEAENRAITAIIGPNGAGKTTVFNCLTGFYRPSVGRLCVTRTLTVIFWNEWTDFGLPAMQALPGPFRTSGCFPR